MHSFITMDTSVCMIKAYERAKGREREIFIRNLRDLEYRFIFSNLKYLAYRTMILMLLSMNKFRANSCNLT